MLSLISILYYNGLLLLLRLQSAFLKLRNVIKSYFVVFLIRNELETHGVLLGTVHLVYLLVSSVPTVLSIYNVIDIRVNTMA